jgi:hypothetical protein
MYSVLQERTFSQMKLVVTIILNLVTVLHVSKIRRKLLVFSVDKKNQLDVTFCILYFSSNSC